MKRPIADRLWEKVSGLGGGPDGCWEWQGHRQSRGYGIIGVNRKQVLTHRLSWELANGPIPDGKNVCHKCDNPPCVNPRHLFIGTQADNMADKSKKGRAGALAGEKHPRSKLTEMDVKCIRYLLSIGYTQQEIADKFNISQSNVNSINLRQLWKHVA